MPANRRRLGFEILESRRVLSGGTVSASLATVFVNVPDNLSGPPGGQVLAPVNIDNAAGVRGAEVRIHYDTTLLDADNDSVLAGSVWPEGSTEVVANVDDSAGSIVVWVFTAEGLDPGSGSLLQVQFSIKNDAPVGGSTIVDLAEVRLNEGEIVPDPEPQPGPDSTDGLITFVSAEDTAGVSGFVYADTNNNHQPDPFEGIPRVKIVLVRSDTGEQWETYTEDDGSYEFRDLAAGSYLIQQRQPAAYLDGGPNEISVALQAGQSLTDQNFRELGLRPEYVYNRLFTTTVMPVGSPRWVSAIRRIVNDADASAGDELGQMAAGYLASLAPESKHLESVDLVFETADLWLLDL